jgi:hypothetical protein
LSTDKGGVIVTVFVSQGVVVCVPVEMANDAVVELEFVTCQPQRKMVWPVTGVTSCVIDAMLENDATLLQIT